MIDEDRTCFNLEYDISVAPCYYCENSEEVINTYTSEW